MQTSAETCSKAGHPEWFAAVGSVQRMARPLQWGSSLPWFERPEMHRLQNAGKSRLCSIAIQHFALTAGFINIMLQKARFQ